MRDFTHLTAIANEYYLLFEISTEIKKTLKKTKNKNGPEYFTTRIKLANNTYQRLRLMDKYKVLNIH